MAGRIIDLRNSGSALSGPVILDSNVVADRLLASFGFRQSRDVSRAHQFFHHLRQSNVPAILTPTAYSEFIHIVIKAVYKEARAAHQSTLSAHFGRTGGFSWVDLYKIEPSILKENSGMLRALRERLLAENVVLLDPADLIASSAMDHYTIALPELVLRFGLDTSDATILFEAQRIGIYAIATFDRDMRRAAADFDIYTWLD
jgi:predicted nucleic acid-binding protein